MRNSKREIECLQRLHALTPVYEELAAFLQQEYLLTQDELKVIRGSPDQAKRLYTKLVDLSQQRAIQLLEFQWEILPVERIRILIVTTTNQKEFSTEL
jgi:hypothetical protein